MLTKLDIKARIPIVDYISRTVDLRKSGKSWMGLCPFHGDTQKSLSVSEEGWWKCHGCERKGDIFSWVMETEKLDYQGALKFLRTKLGDIPQAKLKVLDPELAKRFHDTMPVEKRGYYHKRGLSDAWINMWQLGYSGEAYTIPIFDAKGVLRGIKYRRDDSLPQNKDKPKYWGIEGTSVQLFNPQAAESESPVICEGEFDCMLLEQLGYAACTSTGGAQAFDSDWVSLFSKCQRVYVCMDGDKAGQSAAVKIRDMIGSQAVIVQLPEEEGVKDITDYLLKHNFGGFDKLLSHATAAQEKAERIEKEGILGELNLTGFLRSYVNCVSRLTDAPREYHVAVGLSIVAAAIGNNVSLHLWGDEIFPHIWHVLISPSGFFRKTTAMRLGIKVLETAVPEAVLLDDYTPENLKNNLAARPTGLMKAWEFGNFLTLMDKDYMRGTKEFWTTIYDVGYSKGSQGQGLTRIERPAVSFLAGSTIDWLTEKMRDGDMRGGFLSRFLFLPAYNKTDWKGVINRRLEDDPLFSELVKAIEQIHNVQGQADLSLVRDKLNSWLKEHENQVDTNKLPKDLMGFYSRSATYIAKLAVLFQVAENKGLQVSEDNLDRAITYLEYLYEQLCGLLEDGMFLNNRSAKRIRKVKEILARYPDGIEANEVLRHTHWSGREFNEIKDTLIRTREVMQFPGPPPKRGPKPLMLKLLKAKTTHHENGR